MNTISAIASASLLPLPSSNITAPVQPPNVCSPNDPGIGGCRDQVTWSPGMWWLLNRYEYLFVGLLPQNRSGDVIKVSVEVDHGAEESGLESARPHWDDSRLLNAPPAAGTQSAARVDIPVSQPVNVDQPVAGSIVDLVA